MQNVDFFSLEECLDFLPENEKLIIEVLRELIHETVDNIIEKLSYNVPFYSHHYMMFYIWPSAIQWGNSKTKGVQFGFCQGHLLPDESNYLEKGNRKQVYTKTFHSVKDIDIDLLRSYVIDAIQIDEQLHQDKIRRKRK